MEAYNNGFEILEQELIEPASLTEYDIEVMIEEDRIEWVDSDSAHRLNEEERTAFIKEVMKFCYRSLYMLDVIEIVFVDKKCKKIEMSTSQ